MISDQEVRLDLRAADFSQAPYPAELSRSTPVCLHQILGKLSFDNYFWVAIASVERRMEVNK